MIPHLSPARLSLLAASAWAAAALAQSGNPAPIKPLPTHDPRLVAYYAQATHTQAPGNVSISPDGATIAWTLRGHDGSALHLTAVSKGDTSADKIVAPAGATACSNTAPVWSPDGKTLAYTSTCIAAPSAKAGEAKEDAKPVQPQIFLYSVATGESKQLTHLTGIFQQLAWAPDGKSLAFLFVENATRSAGALAAMKPWSGVIGEDGIEIQRVYSVNAATGAGTWLTPDTLHVFEFDYAPTSGSIAFIAANPPARTTGGSPSSTPPPSPAAPRRRSPSIPTPPPPPSTACRSPSPASPPMASASPSSAVSCPTRVPPAATSGSSTARVASPPTSPPASMAPPPTRPGSPTTPSASSKIAAATPCSPSTTSPSAPPDESRILDLGEVNVSGGPIKDAVALSRTGILAFVQSGHDTPPELWAGPGAALVQITHLNDAKAPHARIESVEWTNESFQVQGWLTYPANYDPAKKYPLLVQVHGWSLCLGRRALGPLPLVRARLLRVRSQPPRQLRSGRKVHRRQPQGLRLR